METTNIIEMIKEYIVPVTMVFCLIIGQVIKGFEKIPNKYIPLILVIAGTAFNIWLNLAITPDVVVRGMASGLAAVGAYELYKHIKPEQKEEVEEVE